MIQSWSYVNTEAAGNFRIFSVRVDTKRSPRTGREHSFYILESADWVNILPVTTAGELVMVEQYRHGSNSVELEIPGGIIDDGDGSPERTAIRELREETGYEGSHAEIIGKVFPNPAIMNNTCYFVRVDDCILQHPTEWDQGEELLTRLVPLDEVPGLVAKGRIRHAIVTAALYHFELWRQQDRGPTH